MIRDLILDNPHYQRLTRQYRSFIWIIVEIALVAFTAVSLSQVIGTPLMKAMYIGALYVPMAAAVTTGRLTAKDVRSEGYQALRVTNLGADRIVWGYIAAVLYNFRLELALIFAMAPVALTLIIPDLATTRWPSLLWPIGWALMGLWPVIVLPGHVFMAAAFGVMFGFLFRDAVWASLAALGLILLLGGTAQFLAYFLLLGLELFPSVLVMWIMLILSILLPYLIGFGVVLLAYRRV
jgi:hypothetical protein